MMNNLPPLVENGIEYEKAGLVHRVLQPASVDGPFATAVLIHGHLGNEDVMWIFKQTLPQDWLLVAPRAIVPYASESFSWAAHGVGEWPSLPQFDEAVRRLTQFIAALPDLYGADLERLYLMGFSQGAATSFATAVSHPGRCKGVASLVGFMPEEVEDAIDNKLLTEIPVFMAVGTEDEFIPLDLARTAGKAARAMGADLSYNEYETGHKLSSAGMRDLKSWWRERDEEMRR